jgi:flagellar biosynthesis/type III secretory pathway protein FliH
MFTTQLAEYRQELKNEGWQEGRQEGRQEGQIELLTKLLVKKFGSEKVSDGVKKRLRNASPQQIDQWLDRILIADKIKTVFADN